MNIAIIGVGEVGGTYARALADRAALQLCDILEDGPPRECADALNLPLHRAPGDWLKTAEIVLVCTPGAECWPVAEAVAGYLADDAVYADMSTANPADLRRAAEHIGRRMVDVAIMSSMQLSGAQSPLLLAGEELGDLQALYESLAARVDMVEDGRPGDATSLKLLRSVLVKGMECLAVEALTAAEAMGVRPQLTSVLRDIDERPFAEFLEMMITTHAPHARRRGHEMRGATAQLRDAGYDGLVTGILSDRYAKTLERLSDEPAAQRVQPMAESLALLLKTVRE